MQNEPLALVEDKNKLGLCDVGVFIFILTKSLKGLMFQMDPVLMSGAIFLFVFFHFWDSHFCFLIYPYESHRYFTMYGCSQQKWAVYAFSEALHRLCDRAACWLACCVANAEYLHFHIFTCVVLLCCIWTWISIVCFGFELSFCDRNCLIV